jgi:hypothetical protein
VAFEGSISSGGDGEGGEAMEQPFQESREHAGRLGRWAHPGSRAVRPGTKAIMH